MKDSQLLESHIYCLMHYAHFPGDSPIVQNLRSIVRNIKAVEDAKNEGQ